MELLRLRRVCRTTKKWVSSFSPNLSAKKLGDFEVIIDGREHTFEWLMNLGLCVQNIVLLNEEWEGRRPIQDFYSGKTFDEFISRISPHVRKLRVQVYRGCHSDNEFRLFESLSSLEELEIDWIDLRKMPKDFRRLPTNCLEKLKVLNVHRYSLPHPKDF
jgi:hypothetical protein